MVRVKICGNKRLLDAQRAVEYGADALGFLVGQKHPSPDFISAKEARSIIEQLPPFVSTVLVTHLAIPKDIVTLAIETRATTVQLHGETTPKQAKFIKKKLTYTKVYKATHVTGVESIDIAKSYLGYVDGLILDSVNKNTQQIGGTGKIHDWHISKKIVEEIKLPTILAGGLNPDNVAKAIRQVGPYAVDVNSGVKAQDGFKDPRKLMAFVENAKSA